MLQPPTDNKHAVLCGLVVGTLMQHLPSHLKRVTVSVVDDEAGAHLAGCEIEVGEDVYELEIRKRLREALA